MSKKKKITTKAQRERKRLENQRYYWRKKYNDLSYTKKGTLRKKVDKAKQEQANSKFKEAIAGLNRLGRAKELAEQRKAKRQAVKLESKQGKAEFKTTVGPFDYFHKKDFIDYVMFNTTNIYYKDKADKKAGIESNYAPGYIVVTKKPRIRLTHYLGIDLKTNLDEALESITYTFNSLWIERPGDSPISMSILFFQTGTQITGYEIID